ncbi:RNA polymerase sigma factor [Aquimarina sp. M1]
MKTKKNQEVIDGIITGDYAILKAFYKRNLPFVRKYIVQNGGAGEDIEDIFQDSLILVYNKLRSGSLQIDLSIHSYFIGVCKNKWRNQQRRQYKVLYDDSLIVKKEDDTQSVIDTITEEDQAALFYKHLHNLNNKNRNILQLFFEGKSMREISTITGYSEGYTRKKKCISKNKLIQMILQDPEYKEYAI